MDYNKEFNQIAADFTALIKGEIKRLGLFKTGKMFNSINFISKKTPSGYKLQMEAVDYFSEVNDKYKIIENALKTDKYKNIEKRIITLSNLMILEELKELTKK